MNATFRIPMMVLLVVAVAGCSKPAANPQAAQPESPKPVARKPMQWPQVEGFEKGELRPFDDPRLGVSLAYHSPSGFTVTAYAYDRGVKDIPDGVNDRTRAEIARAVGDVHNAQRQGLWKSVSGGEVREIRLGDAANAPKALAASLRLQHAEGPLYSEVILTGRQGEFIKLRCTYPAERKAECERELGVLLAAIGEAFNS